MANPIDNNLAARRGSAQAEEAHLYWDYAELEAPWIAMANSIDNNPWIAMANPIDNNLAARRGSAQAEEAHLYWDYAH